ncbi:MAG: hypothetical protein KF678_10975 [Phycisphaeraceae bacterium]|nr:hypothetical protein [Phycisphaeraceae bacterium]
MAAANGRKASGRGAWRSGGGRGCVPGRAGWASSLAALAVLAGGVAEAQILTLHHDSLTAYLPSGASAVQDIRPLHYARGVGIDGSMRAGSVQGWALAGNPFGDSAPSTARVGEVSVTTGTYMPTEIDLALPQPGMAAWRIGRSFNGRQETSGSAHRDSNGYQGHNWFQMSQPAVVRHAGSPDVLYIIYGADRFLEFKQVSDEVTYSDFFTGVNGCAGAVVYHDPNMGEDNGLVDTFVYYDQHGVATHFFGGTSSGAAAYQIWKIVDPAGNVAYVGDATTASTAISSGYTADGGISTAYDAAGRRYCYSYSGSTIGGVKRLEQVLVETDAGGGWGSCGTETLVAKVDYAYYAADDSGKGKTGNLKLVTVTTPMTDSGIEQKRRTYYRYYTGSWANSDGQRGEPHQVKLVLGEEGCRNHDYTADSALEYGGGSDPEFLTDTDANLKAYAAAYLEYLDTGGSHPYRVYKALFNGECGCGGGGTSGTYEFSYAANGSFSPVSGYDDEWKERAVIKQPDNVHASQYFDECGQPISRVVTDSDPSGSPSKTWATEVVRDSSTGCVTAIHTPKNITAYTHSTGAFTRSTSVGLVHVFDRRSTADACQHFPEGVKYKEGNTGTAYFTSWTDYTSRGLVVGTVTDHRPMVSERRSYYAATSTYSTANTYDATTMSYAWWSGTSTAVLYLALKQATTTNPVVTTAQNGSNAATTMDRFVRQDGTTAYMRAPDGIYTHMVYTSGQLTKRIDDVKTNTGGLSPDPNGDFGITETGDGVHRITLHSYDAQGRPDEMTEPDGRVHKSYYSVLVDGRGVTINWPRKTTASGGTYYGPASYGVTNHAGGGEFSGLIAISSSGSTAALTSWIDETDTDPILALTTGTLARMSTTLYDSAGSKATASRTYHNIPASGAGSSGTDYDATTFAYDSMGRKIRTVDPTGTITRASFDELGRTVSTFLGTDDTGLAGSPMAGSSNMVETSRSVYDGGGAGGNSHLTTRTLYVENSTTDQRVTTYDHDFRGRLLMTTNPVAPHSVNKYDNLGRVIATAQYASSVSSSTDPAASGTQTHRVSLHTSSHDALGRVYRTERWEIDQADGSDDDSLTSDTWRDAAGRVIKVKGHELSKTFYDRLGRTTHRFILASENDSTYAHASTVSGEVVLEEHQSLYESTDSDNVMMAVTLNRHGDDLFTTSALDIDGNPFTVGSGLARPQITAMWYDDLDRVIDTVAYGNNGGSSFDRKPSGSWLTVPTRSQTALRTTTTYNDDGTVLETESPGKPSDPSGTSGVKTRFEYDDLGRQTAVINNYVNGSPGGGSNDDEDQIIRYEYSAGLRTKIIADTSGTDQETLYIYGTTAGTPSANKVTTKNRLRAVKYPDSGNAGTTQAYIDGTSDADVVSYAYNAQGQETSKKDQAGNVIETVYDTLGRETARKATTIVGGFDAAIERIATVYLPRGMVDTVTQYDDPSAGTAKDQVKYEYDGWGNLVTFTQDVDSAIGSSGRAAFALSYTYDKATGGRQVIRRDTASYPGGSDLTYVYGGGPYGSILFDPASRVYYMQVGATTAAVYFYHGQDQLTWTNLPEPTLETQSGTSSGYPNWDNFNRPVSSKWFKRFPGVVDFYHIDVNWDKSGSIVGVVDNLRKSGIGGTRRFDVQYTNDNLGRLLRAQEGSLSGTTLSSATRDEQWTDGTDSKLSPTGNWLYRRLDLNGNGTFTDAGDETQSGDATFNTANELTSRTFTLGGGSTTHTYAYDAVGNMTDDGKDYTYTYDVWGRLREVWTRGGSPVLKSEFRYNGLGFRIGWHYDVTRSGGGMAPDGVVDGDDPWYYWMHDERWRQIATFRAGDDDPKERFVYHAAGLDGNGGSSYIDAMVLRDRDVDTPWDEESDGVLEVRHYLCQNWRNDTALVATDAGALVEHTKFSGYGNSFNLPAGDVDSDGDYDATDAAAITGTYDVNKDIDMDGTVGAGDLAAADAVTGGYHAEGRGVLSAEEVGIRKGYAGYEIDPVLTGSDGIAFLHHVRHRVLSSYTGRWNRRDPLGYVDGLGLYVYGNNTGIQGADPTGQAWSNWTFVNHYRHGQGAMVTLSWAGLAEQYKAHEAIEPKIEWLTEMGHTRGQELAEQAWNQINCGCNSRKKRCELDDEGPVGQFLVSRSEFVREPPANNGVDPTMQAIWFWFTDWTFSIGGHVLKADYRCWAVADCNSGIVMQSVWSYNCFVIFKMSDRFTNPYDFPSWLQMITDPDPHGTPFDIEETWAIHISRTGYRPKEQRPCIVNP